MVRVISQETYNEVVNENIELSMSPKEAIQDAIQQFEAQGIDLSNIIKDLILTEQNDLISNYLEQLESATEKRIYDKVPYVLEKLLHELDKGIAYRVYAGKHGAYDTLINLIKECQSDNILIKPALKVITSLMVGNPDLLDDKGISLQMRLLSKQKDIPTLQLLLRWIRECCIKHELNRQRLFNADIFQKLKNRLATKNVNAAELCDICSVLRALVLDDDIRHEYGKSHEHATVIARGILDILTDLLARFKNEKSVVGDLMITMASLVVRDEFCQDVDAAGGLTFILDVMINYPDSEKLNWQAMKLLKALAGNDKVKFHIVTSGSAPLIVSVISRFKKSETVVTAGLACISALTLRTSSHAGVFYDCGAPSIIVDVMKMYPKSINVLQQASWAIRNMSVRNKAESQEFLAYGVEEVLLKALKVHGRKLEDDVKAALRDLGLKVELKERWIGKGGRINSSDKTAV